MKLSSIVKSWFTRSKRRPIRRDTYRPRVEALEDRVTPSMLAQNEGVHLPGVFLANDPYGEYNLAIGGTLAITMESGSILTMGPQTANGLNAPNAFSMGSGVLGNDTVTVTVPAPSGTVFAIPFLVSAPEAIGATLVTEASNPPTPLVLGGPSVLTTPSFAGGGLLPYPVGSSGGGSSTHPTINRGALSAATATFPTVFTSGAHPRPPLNDTALLGLMGPALVGSTSITVDINDLSGEYLTADGSFSLVTPTGFVGQVYFTYAIGLFEVDPFGDLVPYFDPTPLESGGGYHFSNVASVVIDVVPAAAPSANAAALGLDVVAPVVGGPWGTFAHDSARTGTIDAPGITNPALVWMNTPQLMGASGSAVIGPGAHAPTAFVQMDGGVARLVELTGAVTADDEGGTIGSTYDHMGTPTIDAAGRTYVSTNTWHVDAYAPDGTPLWVFARASTIISTDPMVLDASLLAATPPPAFVYVGTDPMAVGVGTLPQLAGRVYAIDPSGVVGWSAIVDGDVLSLSGAFEDGGASGGTPGYYVYARTAGALNRSYLYKMDANTGQVVWRIDTGNTPPLSGGHVTLDPATGLVYYVANSGIVVAANASTGATVWSWETYNPIRGALTLNAAAGILYAPASNGVVAFVAAPAIPPGSGPVQNSPLWTFHPSAGSIDGSLALAAPATPTDPSALYFGTSLGRLVSIDPIAGGLYWDIYFPWPADPAVDAAGDLLITLRSFGAALITQLGPPTPPVFIASGIMDSVTPRYPTYTATRDNAAVPNARAMRAPVMAQNPEPAPLGMLAANPGVAINFQLEGDAAGPEEEVAWQFVSAPAWLSLDEESGEITGTPGPGDVGNHSVIVRATSHWGPRDASLDLFAESVLDIRVMAATTPVVSIDALANQADPAGNLGLFRITRNGSLAGAVTVPFIIGGDAVPGDDYEAIPAYVTLGAGEYEKIIAVVPDDQDAVGKTVMISLAPGTGYDLSTWTSATIVVVEEAMPFVMSPSPSALADPNGTPSSGSGAEKVATTISFTVGAGSGDAVVFNITVTGGAVPSGVIAIMNGNVMIGTAVLDAAGHAIITVTGLSAGSHEITAVYLGDAGHAPSTSAGSIPALDPNSTVVQTEFGPALLLEIGAYLRIDPTTGNLIIWYGSV